MNPASFSQPFSQATTSERWCPKFGLSYPVWIVVRFDVNGAVPVGEAVGAAPVAPESRPHPPSSTAPDTPPIIISIDRRLTDKFVIVCRLLGLRSAALSNAPVLLMTARPNDVAGVYSNRLRT